MKIYAPVKDANGIWCTVRFVNGVGETDDPRLIEWFRNHGYKVPVEDNYVKSVFNSVKEVENDQIDDVKDEIKSQRVETLPTTHESESEMLDNGNQPDFEKMTPNEIRDWARANGYGSKIKNTRNKEKLLEILRG